MSARERIHEIVDQAVDSGRYIVAVWHIAKLPDPDTGQINDRIPVPLVEVHRWPTGDFPTALAQIKKEFSEIASNPQLRDPPDGDSNGT
jgi:hypothetical protein